MSYRCGDDVGVGVGGVVMPMQMREDSISSTYFDFDHGGRIFRNTVVPGVVVVVCFCMVCEDEDSCEWCEWK